MASAFLGDTCEELTKMEANLSSAIQKKTLPKSLNYLKKVIIARLSLIIS